MNTFFIFPFASLGLVHSYFLKRLEYRSATLQLMTPSNRVTIYPLWSIGKVKQPEMVTDFKSFVSRSGHCFWHEFSLTLALLIKLWGVFSEQLRVNDAANKYCFPHCVFSICK